MVKQINKPFFKEPIEWKAAEDQTKDRIDDRLRWQHALNTAIKKELISNGSAKSKMLIN